MNIDHMGLRLDKIKVFKYLDYKPHPKQMVVHNSKARFRLLACGRRWGKSLSASKEVTMAALKPEQYLWVVAPTYPLADKVFREVYKDFIRYFPTWIASASESMMRIKLINGSVIEGKSADNPDSLIGEGLNGCVIDEAARIKKTTWEESLFPTLSDKQGWLLAISTPRGMNWFHEMFTEGQDKLITDTESWSFATSTNPHIITSEISRAKKMISSRAYEQEYEARFLTDAGGVFRNVKDCIREEYRDSRPETRYVVGVDLAKYSDFTVICVIDIKDSHLVYFDRFNQVDWSLQKRRICSVAKQYNNAEVNLDATGVGDPIYEDLQNEGLYITGHKFTNKFKTDLIDNLAMLIERKEISFPDIPELINELNIFEYKKTTAGNVTLNAPDGYHDDCVIALALAAMGLINSRCTNSFPIA